MAALRQLCSVFMDQIHDLYSQMFPTAMGYSRLYAIPPFGWLTTPYEWDHGAVSSPHPTLHTLCICVSVKSGCKLFLPLGC